MSIGEEGKRPGGGRAGDRPAPDGVVGVDDAARLLGVSDQTLVRLCELVGVGVRRLQIGRRRTTVLALDDLHRLRDALVRTPAPPPPTEPEPGAAWIRARQLEAHSAELEFQRRLLEVELASTRTQRDDAESELARTRGQVDALRIRLERADRQCERLDDARVSIATREAALGAREAELDRRERELAAREASCEREQRDAERVRQELEEALQGRAADREELANVREELAVAREDAAALRATIGAEREARSAAEAEREALRASLETAEEVERSTQRYCDRLERRVRALTEGLRPHASDAGPERPPDQGPSANAG